jgi:surfactin synthase thioesterase subunit
MTLAKEMKKPGANYFYAHSQGSHIAYYVAKKLKAEFNINLKAFVVSNFPVPVALPPVDVSSLKERVDVCVPLRYIVGKVKQGWGVDTRLAFKNHMGYAAYQSQELWPKARALIHDHWLTKEFPLPGSDAPLDCPVMAIYGKDDPVVSLEEVQEWKNLSSVPAKFSVTEVAGDHVWPGTDKGAEILAKELGPLLAKFP